MSKANTWDDTLNKIKSRSGGAFFAGAMDRIRATGGATIKADSPEFLAWWAYFDDPLYDGWRPAFMYAARGSDREVTMPTAWPEEYDASAPQMRGRLRVAKRMESLRPQLEELKARYGPTWGIRQPVELDDPAAREKAQRRMAEVNERALLAEYQVAGLEPRRTADGVLISLSLLRTIEQSEKRGGENG